MTNDPTAGCAPFPTLGMPSEPSKFGGNKHARLIVPLALGVGVALRILLAVCNHEANDPHLPVIEILAVERRTPRIDEAWEAFQPLLYHRSVAGIWSLMETKDPAARNLAAQLTSLGAAILTLLIIWQFLRDRGRPTLVSALGFATVALNPALVSMSGQATNDAFVILFGTLTLYFGLRFLNLWNFVSFIALSVSAIFAGLSKGNGLVVIIAVTLVFALGVIWPGRNGRASRPRYALALAAFLLPVLLAIAQFGPYVESHRRFGTPFMTNWTPSPPPHVYRETFVERPGLTSLAHGLVTFRIIDLLRHPESTSDPTHYPRHRTSLWTRIFAQAHSAHFEAWPPSWKASHPWILDLGRLLFALGLVPTAFFLRGLFAKGAELVRVALGRGSPEQALAWHGHALLVLSTIGYLAFATLYSVRLRDYSSMKAIFVLPGLLGFMAIFLRGLARIDAGMEAQRLSARIAAIALALLAVGYVVDLSVLVADLAQSPFPK